MGDEVQRCFTLGEAGDRRVDIVRERRDWLAATSIVDLERRESARPECLFEPFQGRRASRDPVKQNHSWTTPVVCLGRLAHFSYATSRSGADASSRAIALALT